MSANTQIRYYTNEEFRKTKQELQESKEPSDKERKELERLVKDLRRQALIVEEVGTNSVVINTAIT